VIKAIAPFECLDLKRTASERLKRNRGSGGRSRGIRLHIVVLYHLQKLT
jgi:hypothetical protein